MAKFNQKAKNPRKVVNYEGEKAWKLTPKLELYNTVCVASLENKFYESSFETLERIKKLIAEVVNEKNGVEYICKLAIYTREQMYLRSIPLVLVVELLKYIDIIRADFSIVEKTITRVIQRADELTEIMAYYALANGRDANSLKKLVKPLKIGVANAFNKFDSYQLSKYNRDNAIKLKDVMFVTHPKPDKEHVEIFKQLANDKLPTPYTWETQLSLAGKEGKDKKQVWEELIDSEKVGIMALIRNLRNILQVKVSDKHIEKVCNTIENKNVILESKLLPFRFFSAYMMLKDLDDVNPFHLKRILRALEIAVRHSIDNVKLFNENEKILIASDVSGSMQKPISSRSKVELYHIGLLLGQLLQYKYKENAITGFFGDDWKVVNLYPDNILSNTFELREREGEVGYSTNGYKVIEYLIKQGIKVDKIMIFTDCQLWNSNRYYGDDSTLPQMWNTYKQINPEAKLYLFDLAGYGQMPIDVIVEKNVYMISGWSEKIFDMLKALEEGNNVLDKIDEIKI